MTTAPTKNYLKPLLTYTNLFGSPSAVILEDVIFDEESNDPISTNIAANIAINGAANIAITDAANIAINDAAIIAANHAPFLPIPKLYRQIAMSAYPNEQYLLETSEP